MAVNKDRISVVTGASRGAGQGIAVGLARVGGTIYVTGRSADTIEATARQVDEAGGVGIAVVCDHADDAQVQNLFERVAADHGRLDLLVNNATDLPAGLTDRLPFWEKSLDQLRILDVGMRSHYVATYFAAPLLLAEGGLVVTTSSPGGSCYMHGPAYGAGKAAADKMAHDMAFDFKEHDVAMISLWLGLVLTEGLQAAALADPERMGPVAAKADSPEFNGLLIDALANDPAVMEKSGQVFYCAELAHQYGITDVDGKVAVSHRDWLGAPTVFSPSVVR